MSDILLDPSTGDIAMVGCSPKLTTNLAELVTQRLYIRLNTFLGEWFYNVEVGVPYFEEVLTRRFDKSLVDSLLRSVILETEDVVNIVKFEGVFIPELRTYKINYAVEIDSSIASGAANKADVHFIQGNIIDNLSNSIVLSGGSNLVYNTANPDLKC